MREETGIVLFDGVCNFCNATVRFIIRKERKPELKFASLQSETGQSLLKKYNIEQDKWGSFVLIEDGKAYLRSSAGLRLCGRFKGLWPMMKIFLIVPAFIRDGVYNFISKNRYKWWGKSVSCQIPSPELRNRFIEIN